MGAMLAASAKWLFPGSIVFMILAFVYSLIASAMAYRESGQAWMLLYPTWVDAKSGVSARVRWHGKIAFALLLVSLGVFMASR